MPIKPENKKLYPPNWKEIRARIIARAGNRCEGSPRYPDCRAENGELHPVTGSKVVLTVAHLDHNPENSDDDDNLRAWCQRCHNTYDAPFRALNRRITKLVEQLRASNDQMLTERHKAEDFRRSGLHDREVLDVEIDRLKAENEQLQEHYNEELQSWRIALSAKKREIERLKASNIIMGDMISTGDHPRCETCGHIREVNWKDYKWACTLHRWIEADPLSYCSDHPDLKKEGHS